MTNQAKTIHRLDTTLVEKAVEALLKHHNANIDESKALLGSDVALAVQFALEVAPESKQMKPIQIKLPNAIHKIDDNDCLVEPEVCLIVKDDSKEKVQEIISRFPKHMGCIKKVLGLQSLRNKHAEYQQRRDLLSRYTHFMADDRILPMLTKALGKDFIRHKKQPVPIRINRTNSLPFAVEAALSATYLHIPEGTCLSVCAGNTAMSVSRLVANILAVTEAAGQKIPRKWANIRCISVKLPKSTSLPVYSKTPTDLLELANMAGITSAYKKVGVSLDANSEDKDKKKPKKARYAKSPLLRALKKQKIVDKESKVDFVTTIEDTQEEGNVMKRDISTQKKRDRDDVLTKQQREIVAEREKISTQSEKEETVKAKKSNRKARKESKAAQEKNRNGNESTKKKTTIKAEIASGKKAVQLDKTSFIASKMFKGSKVGYVFKRASQGIGYYIDDRPVVDKMALQALARSTGGRTSPGKKRRRR